MEEYMNEVKHMESIREILLKATQSYKAIVNEDEKDSFQWFKNFYISEIDGITDAEAENLAEESVVSLAAYDADKHELEKAKSSGISRADWLSNKINQSATSASQAHQVVYYKAVDEAFKNANNDMVKAITTQSGAINMNPNLDGFIAEQAHANSYNLNAAIENSSFRARSLQPEVGQTYGKNSVDISVDNIVTGQKNVQRIQAKFGKSSKASANMVKDKNYNNQRVLVPKGQADDVKGILGKNKTVSDTIETSDGVSSEALSKAQVKEMQARVQSGKKLPQKDWNHYSSRQLAMNIGKQSMITGATGATIGASFHIAGQLLQGKDIKSDEVIEAALVTGADAGAKAATTGALVVAARKGVLPIAKTTSAAALGMTGAIVIENAKILYKLGKGEMTPTQAMDGMGEATTIGVTSCLAAAEGMARGAALSATAMVALSKTVGATLGSVVPVVGTMVGAIVGSVVGTVAGSAIYKGAKTIVKGAYSAVKSVGKAVGGAVKSVARALNPFNWF